MRVNCFQMFIACIFYELPAYALCSFISCVFHLSFIDFKEFFIDTRKNWLSYVINICVTFYWLFWHFKCLQSNINNPFSYGHISHFPPLSFWSFGGFCLICYVRNMSVWGFFVFLFQICYWFFQTHIKKKKSLSLPKFKCNP